MRQTFGGGLPRRALSLLVALAMVLGMCPTAGVAEGALGEEGVLDVSELAVQGTVAPGIGAVYHVGDTLPGNTWFMDSIYGPYYLTQDIEIVMLRGNLIVVGGAVFSGEAISFDTTLHFRAETNIPNDATTAVKITSGDGTQDNPYAFTPQYRARFDVAGGSPSPAAQDVWMGDKLSETSAPTRDGYSFDGWYNGNAEWDFAEGVLDRPMTLTAHWTESVEYPLWVAGTRVTSENAADVLGEADGDAATASFTPAEGDAPAKLTLDCFSCGVAGHSENNYAAPIYWGDESTLAVELRGESALTAVYFGSANLCGIYSAGGLRFEGSGSLAVGRKGGTYPYGIRSNKGGLVIDGATLTAESDGTAIHAYYDITINGGEVTVRSANTFGLYSNRGAISVTGGTVRAVGGRGVYSYSNSVVIGEGVESFVAAGPGGAFNSETIVKNSLAGTGWTDADGTQGRQAIEAKPDGQNLDGLKRVQFPAAHAHDLTYSADGATITATCGAEGCDLTDARATLTVSAPTLSTYGGAGDAEATLDADELVAFNAATGLEVKPGDVTYVGRDGTTYDEGAAAPTDAGKYAAKLTLPGVKTGPGSTGDVTASVDYEIAKAEVTVTTAPTASAITYGQTLAESSLTGGEAKRGGDVVAGTFAWADGGTAPQVADGGTTGYAVTFTPDDPNLAEAGCEATVEVSPREAKLSWSGTSFAYDGKSHAPTATVSNLVPGDECAVTVTGAQAKAGTFTATATKLSNANYRLPASKTSKFTVAPREAKLAWDGTSFAYDGKSHKPTATVSNLVAGDECSVTVSGAQAKAGTFTATATRLSNANYRLPAKATQGFKVAPRVARLSWKGTSFAYDGKSHKPTATVSNLVPGDKCSVTVSGAQAKAGTHTATATKLSNANYRLPDKATRAFTVAQAPAPARQRLTSIAKVADQAYTGRAIEPTPAVRSGGRALRAGTDFAYSYRANVGAGTATVTATGRGDYAGSVKTTFRIVAPSASARAHVQGAGWLAPETGGAVAGTTGRSLRLESLRLSLAGPFPVAGGIRYRAHVQGSGWERSWSADGAACGTTGRSRRMEAVQVRLTGEMARRYDVWYRVHSQSYGWMAWASNGASAGTAGQSRRMEAVQVVVLPKGARAPGAAYGGVSQDFGRAFV